MAFTCEYWAGLLDGVEQHPLSSAENILLAILTYLLVNSEADIAAISATYKLQLQLAEVLNVIHE